MKRFYKLVSTHKEPQGWSVHLDGRPVKTPLKEILLAPSEGLADEIVREWAAQEDEITPEDMPLTQILSTQIDRVTHQRAEVTALVCKYLDTDLLCYRAEPEPPGPAQKQAEIWDPWLDWFEKHFGTKLETTTGLAALVQPKAAHAAVQKTIDGLDDARFNILQLVVSGSGSLVLGLAFMEGVVTPDHVLTAARVEEHLKDEIYDAEKYGRDPMFEKKDAALLRDLQAARLFLEKL